VIVVDTASVNTSFVDTGLSSNTHYIYRVSAINIVGTRDLSNEAKAKTDNKAKKIL